MSLLSNFSVAPNPKNSCLGYLSNSNLVFSSSFFTNKKIIIYRNYASDKESDQTVPPLENEVDNIGVKAALSVLKFYRSEISPLLPKSCRYVPTCSEYSMIAYKKYGFLKGSALTACRICRCNPLGGTGFDPQDGLVSQIHRISNIFYQKFPTQKYYSVFFMSVQN